MSTYCRCWHLFILLLMLIAGLLTQWFQPTSVAGQALPPQAQEPAIINNSTSQAHQPSAVPGPFAFGVATAQPDGARVDRMGFNWMLVYDPPNHRQPVNVLYRLPVNHWSYDPDDYYSRWQFQDKLYRLAGEQGDWIDAYEIGNEVNLYVNGWEAPPNPNTYVELLCLAYDIIKIMDPTAIVVSAGLAPVGRVSGDWNGFTGHNYLIQDEREYFRAFLAAGGADCADVFGYHPLGFSADFDAEPDVDGGTPESNCANGFCFRGVEKFWEIIAEFGQTGKPIWATEVGWIVEPDDPRCLDDYSWAGRGWQRVSPEKQAENLVGAFTYAHEHLPWLGGIFVFNLNFQDAPYYHPCEQMRYYSMQESSETALRGMIEELFDFVYLPLITNHSIGSASPSTIYHTLVENGNFTTLLKIIDQWGLRQLVDGTDARTLFAPTDAAFAALMEKFNLTEAQFLTLPELPDALRYHLVEGAIPSTELNDGMMLQTLQGAEIRIGVNGDTRQIDGTATIIAADVVAANGVIHVIDAVLIPPVE